MPAVTAFFVPEETIEVSSRFIGLFSVVLLLYAAASYYVGLRIFQSFYDMFGMFGRLYWVCFAGLAASPFIARLSRIHFRGRSDKIAVIGNYWLAVLYYLTLIWLVADFLYGLFGLFRPPGRMIIYPSDMAGLGILLFVMVIVGYGVWNARRPRIVHYDIVLGKTVAGLSGLHAVMVSDVHLGVIVDQHRLEDLVKRVNELEPDIVFLAGDIIDEDVSLFVERKMPEALSKLKTRYGVFAVLGNHEYLGGNSRLAVESLQQAGVRVLRDEYVKVNDQFYIVGRDDRMVANVTGKPRRDLGEFMGGMNKALPIVLLDHQPYRLKEGQQNGVDLQLSGHTHHGQFFPNHLITERIFENDWGYVRKGKYQVVVSCGYGTWGPPIRIGNAPEIVDLSISFRQDAE